MLKNRFSVVRAVTLVGIMTATIECGKLVLMALPNVEVVTLLIALYGYVFGPLGMIASVLFVMIEPLIWGFNLWVVSYFLYWPLVSFVFMLLRKAGLKNRLILSVAAILLTAWFGVLSSLVDVGLFTGNFDNFFTRFIIYYVRGIWFYITQIVTNAILFPILFPVLSDTLGKLKGKFLKSR